MKHPPFVTDARDRGQTPDHKGRVSSTDLTIDAQVRLAGSHQTQQQKQQGIHGAGSSRQPSGSR
jgi:hypothetical protein